uniref:Uncharacterized protein n=1 Tax=Nelumbo nucifera TaxID=4432 RepID=A0A822Y4C7_NELNU|nr:TPA_asm: hypothetical protein HUJ06_028765 [Nelumbo nucifera]
MKLHYKQMLIRVFSGVILGTSRSSGLFQRKTPEQHLIWSRKTPESVAFVERASLGISHGPSPYKTNGIQN